MLPSSCSIIKDNPNKKKNKKSYDFCAKKVNRLPLNNNDEYFDGQGLMLSNMMQTYDSSI